MNLKQAAQKVIAQNISVGYTPTRFIQVTEGGNAVNLDEVISRLVLKAELLEELERQIKLHPDIITIEDLIAESDDGFGLPEEVIKIAKARHKYFDMLRKIYKKF